MECDKQLQAVLDLIPEIEDKIVSGVRERWDFAGIRSGNYKPVDQEVKGLYHTFSYSKTFPLGYCDNMFDVFTQNAIGKIFDDELRCVYDSSLVKPWTKDWNATEETFSNFVKRKIDVTKKQIISVSIGKMMNRLFQNPGIDFVELDKANLAAGVLGRVGQVTIVTDRKHEEMLCWLDPKQIVLSVSSVTTSIEIIRTGIIITYLETLQLV